MLIVIVPKNSHYYFFYVGFQLTDPMYAKLLHSAMQLFTSFCLEIFLYSCCTMLPKNWIIDYDVPQQSWLLIPIRVNSQCWQFISIQLIVEQHNCTSNFTTTYSFISLLSKFIDIYEGMCDTNEMCHLILFTLCLLLRGQSSPSKDKCCT